MKRCHHCGTEWPGITQPSTRETCRTCGQDLHSCANCRFHEKGRPNECIVDTDPVDRKDRANYCEEFQMGDRGPGKQSGGAEADRAREQWKKLFGG